jgi:hypothetical protein
MWQLLNIPESREKFINVYLSSRNKEYEKAKVLFI